MISCSKLSLEKVSIDRRKLKHRKGCKVHATITAESLPLSIGPEDGSKRFIEVLGRIREYLRCIEANIPLNPRNRQSVEGLPVMR